MRIRAERATLLGFANHAAYKLEDQTARTPAAVNAMLRQLAPPAVANAKREAAELQKVIDREGGGFKLAPWDWDFYSEKVRAEKYAFDEIAAQALPRAVERRGERCVLCGEPAVWPDLQAPHRPACLQPDVRVYDVFDASGKPLAIFIADMYARKSKNGGAWMNEYVSQSTLMGTRPVVANHLNIPKPPAGEPTLLTWDEVITAFHEFGHALHGMFSNVKYPYFAGTSVRAISWNIPRR